MDLFEPENEPTLFREYNNLVTLPLRNYDHFKQMLQQVSIGDSYTFLFDIQHVSPDNVIAQR